MFVVALAAGTAYSRAFERTGTPPEPWVRELSAAVAFACGHGYADPGYAPSPAFEAFLDKKIGSLTCDAIPPGTAFSAPNFTQRLYRYMTLAVGIVWRLFGVSWASLSVLFGVMYAVSAIATYALFRLAAGPAVALAGTAASMASPLQLRYLPQLREYAKVPFILTLIVIAAVLVFGPFGRRRLLLGAAAYGAVMGIGFGFRNDLLINIVPFGVTVLLFLPGSVRAYLPQKLAALGVCAAAFLICAWPIVRAYQSGSNNGHVAVLGLMRHFDDPLGVTASVYDWGETYDDGFAIKIISSFAHRVEHRDVVALSREYDAAALHLLRVIVRNFPADFLTRAYASVLGVAELPFQIRSYVPAVPPALEGAAVAPLYAGWDAVFSKLGGIGVGIVALAIAGAAARSVRHAVWLLIALLYFGGYPALQFDPRHFFFLEFIPWLAIAIVVGGAIDWLVARRFVPRFRQAAAFVVAAAVCLFGSAATLRAYQQRHVGGLLEQYNGAPLQPLALERIADGRHVLLRPTAMSHVAEPTIRAEYVVVDVDPRRCGRIVTPVTFRYVTQETYTDLSERLVVPESERDGPTRLFFPVYYAPGGYFSGIETTADGASCISAVYRVADVSRTEVLMNLMLPPDWRSMQLYQTVTRWERPNAPYRVRVYSWPRTLDVSALDFFHAPLPALPSAHSHLVSANDGGWVVRGLVRDSTSMITRLPERVAARHVCFFARGRLLRGGFTVGITRDAAWATTVNVTVPGEFLAVVEVPEDGRYAPAFANFLSGINRWNDFVVTDAGWVEPPPS